jgi:hypothetical protein
MPFVVGAGVIVDSRIRFYRKAVFMATIEDERTGAQKSWILVGGIDRFMSGWGGAKNGKSWAFWACPLSMVPAVGKWVKERGDIVHYRELAGNAKLRFGRGHVHIYPITNSHPAIRRQILLNELERLES